MRRADKRGVTLVELLIAVSIFAFIVASAYLLLRSFNKTYSRGMSQAAIRQKKRLLLRVITKDISSMYRQCRGATDSLDFYSLIIRGDTNHLSEVHYRFSNGNLYRAFELDSDEDLSTRGQEEVLLSGLKAFDFSYLLNGSWSGTWSQDGLPEAVKILLEWRDGGQLEVALDVMTD